MTQFSNENLNDSNGWLSYGPERKFVANFSKRGGGKATFIKFLIKNFTVEEYFEMLETNKSPLGIAQTKGYVLPHIKKWLKDRGLPQTSAGFDTMIQQNMAARLAA
jgi:hypothetical protein